MLRAAKLSAAAAGPQGPPVLEPADLDRRWRRARGTALGVPVSGSRADSRADTSTAPPETATLAALAEAPAERRELALSALFRSSWRLGRSAAERFGPVGGPAAAARLLGELKQVPCAAVSWRLDGELAWSEAAGCAANPERLPFVCDAYREAIDGLVCGLGDGVRFARRSSRGRGGAVCQDLLFPTARRELAWSTPPAELAPALAEIATGLAARGVRIRILGMAENRLGYQVESADRPACGAGALVHALIENHFHHRLPGIELSAAEPRSVL